MATKKLSNLQEKLSSFNNQLEIMENREKGELTDLYDIDVTIRDYGFIDGEDGKFVCFITDEVKENFYFGGMVLTENFLALEEEGLHADVIKEGVKVRLYSKRSKNGKNYTAIKYL